MVEANLLPGPARTCIRSGMGLRIAIGSSKGGSGVSMLARNMAVFLAQVGKRTALLDMSGNLAGLEGLAGIEERTLERQGSSSLHLRGVLQNLEVYFALRDPVGLYADIDDRLDRGEYEVMIVDLRCDGSPLASRIMRSAPLRLVVTTPEPPSVYELYACASALVEDEVNEKLGPARGTAGIRERTGPGSWLAGFLSPADVLAHAGAPELADATLDVVRRMRVGFVLNMAQEREDFDLPRAIESVATRVFLLPLVDMGTVERDDAMGAAVRHRLPLLVHMPHSKSGRDLEAIVRRLLSTAHLDRLRPRLEVRSSGQDESHYEALEVDRGAGEHEIRKATRRIQEVFGGHTHATVELSTPDPLNRILARAAEAHGVLLDQKSKREYDRHLLREEGAMLLDARTLGKRPLASSVPAVLPSPAGPLEPVPEGGVTGAWLALMREQRGLTLDDMSGISKVSVTYLEAIEKEAFALLPATVYVRGFLVAYARTLNLPADSVARSYLSRMSSATR